jgi:Ca2+/Na+ antiporter
MKEQDLSKLTTDELKAKEKTIRVSFYFMLGAVFILLSSSIYLTIVKGFNVFTVLPIAFLPLVKLFSKQLKQIKGELEKRN